MAARPRVTTAERRAGLVARHHLRRTAADVETAARSLVAVHSSDPMTPYLAMRARVPGFVVSNLDAALYENRSLWRTHAMRRTLFVIPTDQAATVYYACGRDVAATERRRLERWVADARRGADARRWLADVEARTCAVLADGRPRRTQELTGEVEDLAQVITVGSGKWAAATPLSSRLLFVLAMERRIVRAHPAGSWLSSQYHWADARSWFGGVGDGPADARTARAQLAQRYLRSHAPATTADLKWWTGWTVRATITALGDVGAVEVDLEDDSSAWVLPNFEPVQDPDEGVAFLPSLDPTVMGWKERQWYLGDHGPRLFDRNGNAGPTIWASGRVVGGWAQLRDGQVVYELLDEVGSRAQNQVRDEAEALTAWFGGVVGTPRFRTPLERELSR